MPNPCRAAVKTALCLFNVAIWTASFFAFGATTWILIDDACLSKFIGTNLLPSAVYILLVIAIVAPLGALFGCVGTVREIKFILVIYFTLLFIIFVVTLAGGILGYIFIQTVENTMETEMYNTLKYYSRDKELKGDWDQVQAKFHCCGVNSHRDWLKVGNIPESCRVKPNTPPFITSEYYPLGCLNATMTQVQWHGTLLGHIGVAVASLTLPSMLFSWLMYMIIE